MFCTHCLTPKDGLNTLEQGEEEEGGRDRWIRRMTRNKRTDSHAEGGKKEQTIETQLQRHREVLFVKIFCCWLFSAIMLQTEHKCVFKIFYVT